MVWVTGSPSAGKSTVCALLKARHVLAVDGDWEGYNHWVDRASGQVVAEFLCGSVENEVDVRDLFDRVVCLVADNATLRDRLVSRTTNKFGKHPEELAAALAWNSTVETRYRRLGATIIDGTLPPPRVADAIRCRCGDCPRPTTTMTNETHP